MLQAVTVKKSEAEFCSDWSEELDTVLAETEQLRGIVGTMLSLADEKTARPVEPKHLVNFLWVMEHALEYIQENITGAIRHLDIRAEQAEKA